MLNLGMVQITMIAPYTFGVRKPQLAHSKEGQTVKLV
jgi:hypothetical protein